jgi:hypothetical protein
MRSRQKRYLFALGLAAGAFGAIWLIRRSLRSRQTLKFLIWQQSLADRYGDGKASEITRRVQNRYADLYFDRPIYDQRALQRHLDEQILPGLALYQVLKTELGSREAALAETSHLFQASSNLLLFPVWLLGILPDPFAFLKRANRQVMRRDYPTAGWDVEWLQDSRDRFSFNIYHCFYLTVLSSYGAPELTPLFCNIDDYMMERLPSSISWRRTRTLGRGDALCDFSWCRHRAG